MIGPTLKNIRTYFTALGAALPSVSSIKHGQFTIKQALSTFDEVWMVLRNGSGTLVNERVITKTYGDTVYSATAHSHASTLIVQEGGVTTDATVGTLNFDASDFTLTEAPEDTVTIALAYGTGAGTPAEGNHTHVGGGSTIIVQEGGVEVDPGVTTLNFDASDFTVTESPEDTVTLGLAYGTGAGTPSEGNHLHDATYVNVTGDTMTGALIIDLDDTGALTVRKADDTRVFVVDTTNKQVEIQNGGLIQGWNLDGSDQKFFWQASTGTLGIYDGGDLLLYSDAGTTQKFAVDGATGDLDTEGQITLGAGGAEIIEGSATPEGAANAPVGSAYLRTGATIPNTELYIKQAGTGTDTGGWVPVNQGIQVTLGPFYINDLPGTATTQATLGYFNTATAVSRDATDPHLRTAGRIVGLIVVSDVARTAGTATGRVRIAGADTAFNGGAVLLDATNTEQDASFVNHASGVAFTNAQTIGVNITTSGWTPITANITAWLVVSLDPFV
jgi:hypothetical protein